MNTVTADKWWERSYNPFEGCTPISPGCKNCWAQRMLTRFGRPTELTLHPERLDKPLRWRKPRLVFVGSLGDLFHDDVPTNYITQVWETMARADRHTFLVLTKRPLRMHAWVSLARSAGIVQWPLPNVWLGTTVESEKYTGRLDTLLVNPAAHRFVSIEPMLGPVDLRPWLDHLDWVIAGGEMGPGARRSHFSRLESLRYQCHDAGVPLFQKQWGSNCSDVPDHVKLTKQVPDELAHFFEDGK